MKRLCLIIGILVLSPLASRPQSLKSQTKQTKRSEQERPNPIKREPDKGTKDLLSPLEREVIVEINLARTNPTQYLHYLENFRRSYNGKELKFSNGESLITNEGVAALEEAINFVRSAKPLAPLEIRNGLVLAAKDHLNDLVKTGKSGHRGSDGSSVEDRFTRYGTWSDSVGEDIVYHSRTARENVISLIIDDGVANRGHRRNIFKPTFGVIGIALGPPLKSGTLCIITFAGGFKDKTAADLKSKVPTAVRY
jgi:uncharacterized protein YkwD